MAQIFLDLDGLPRTDFPGMGKNRFPVLIPQTSVLGPRASVLVFRLVDEPVEELMVGSPPGRAVLFLFNPGHNGVDFGIQVIEMVQKQRLQGHRQFGRPEFVFSMMAED